MPRTSGTYAPPVNSVSPAAPLTPIESADFNALIEDIVAALTDSLSRSGNGAMLAAFNAGAFRVTNLAAPSVATDAATKSYVDAATLGLAWKVPVRFVATTGTLATAFENGDTCDGLTIATGDRFLYAPAGGDITAGIYIAAASGAPSRATDFDAGSEVFRAAVLVLAGTVGIRTQWTCTNATTPLVGTDSIVLVQFSTGASNISIINTTLAAMHAVGNAINTTGKYRDLFVADEDDRVWRALGSGAADKWRPLDDQSNTGSDITPA